MVPWQLAHCSACSLGLTWWLSNWKVSVVTHSQNYTLGVCFRRYFDSVYSLRLLFPRHGLGTTSSMGAKNSRPSPRNGG